MEQIVFNNGATVTFVEYGTSDLFVGCADLVFEVNEIDSEPVDEWFHISTAADGLYGDVEKFFADLEGGKLEAEFTRRERYAALTLDEAAIKKWLNGAVIPGCYTDGA